MVSNSSNSAVVEALTSSSDRAAAKRIGAGEQIETEFLNGERCTLFFPVDAIKLWGFSSEAKTTQHLCDKLCSLKITLTSDFPGGHFDA